MLLSIVILVQPQVQTKGYKQGIKKLRRLRGQFAGNRPPGLPSAETWPTGC